MVSHGSDQLPEPINEAQADELMERLSVDRPSRRRKRRQYRRSRQRQVRVHGERHEVVDHERMSKALVAAQRELAAAQAEAEARRQAEVDTASPESRDEDD